MRTPHEQTVLITGATNGLGRVLAELLAGTGRRVLLHGRDPVRVEQARSEITDGTGNDRVEVLVADLAALHEVDRLAEDVRSRCPRLDALVNNAGIGTGGPDGARQVSRDGIELRFAVNYLAGYRLITALEPLLLDSAPARVLSIASAGQRTIDFADPLVESDYTGTRAYAQSKLAQIMFTFDLAERWRGRGVEANALHPATYMNTAMVREAGVTPVNTVRDGADAALRLVTDPAFDGVTGRFFHGSRESRPLDQAFDPAARARLRELSDELVAEAVGPGTVTTTVEGGSR
ncbi:SDR family NAD(P)-dependent oxidoreductase [Saccharopolyspora cebuensis]|uniref:SDR family NAD(P)-dependent oxidoreductase n=1 Tax=Saccharopolyspora cebuensis TaxID=418759 RepID=A0ABV4CCZ7_9PSEU